MDVSHHDPPAPRDSRSLRMVGMPWGRDALVCERLNACPAAGIPMDGTPGTAQARGYAHTRSMVLPGRRAVKWQADAPAAVRARLNGARSGVRPARGVELALEVGEQVGDLRLDELLDGH